IVDQRAERAELVRSLEQFEDVALLGDIAFHCDRLAVLRLDRGNDLVRCRLVAGIADNDAPPTARGGERGGAADAAAAAGDDNAFIVHNCPPIDPMRGSFTDRAPAAPGPPGSPSPAPGRSPPPCRRSRGDRRTAPDTSSGGLRSCRR